MRQVFRILPWVLPPDPAPVAEIFHRLGREIVLDKGQTFSHGGVKGGVYLITQGLVTFSFVDIASRSHIFAIVFPGCALGDLDSLPVHAPSVIAECINPCRALMLSGAEYQRALRTSIELMESYAHMCVMKEESILEGAFSNYTLDLETRLRLLLYSIVRKGVNDQIEGGYLAKMLKEEEKWYPLPWSPTVTQISQIVGANRSWASTKISDWINAGLMQRQGRNFSCRAELFLPLQQFKPSEL